MPQRRAVPGGGAAPADGAGRAPEGQIAQGPIRLALKYIQMFLQYSELYKM